MDTVKEGNEILRLLTGYAETFTDSVLDELLQESPLKADQRIMLFEQFKKMHAELHVVSQAFKLYEENNRRVIKQSLEEFLSLLLNDHASRSSLIHGLADVLVKAAEINFLDKELMGLLSRIVSKVKWPEDLPAFQDGVLPSGTAWPQYSLKRIYEEKSGAYQDFLNSAYFLVMPAIVAGTEELKKKKKNLESVVKAMEGCITLIGMMKKMLCIVS